MCMQEHHQISMVVICKTSEMIEGIMFIKICLTYEITQEIRIYQYGHLTFMHNESTLCKLTNQWPS
jgi:hypothetical protein